MTPGQPVPGAWLPTCMTRPGMCLTIKLGFLKQKLNTFKSAKLKIWRSVTLLHVRKARLGKEKNTKNLIKYENIVLLK